MQCGQRFAASGMFVQHWGHSFSVGLVGGSGCLRSSRFIARMTKYMTLYPGDVIWMGTEGATENIKHGDTVEIEITGIGVLRNPVVREGK